MAIGGNAIVARGTTGLRRKVAREFRRRRAARQ